MGFPIVDADTHVNEAESLWQERVPAKLRDRAPRVVEREGGGKAWVFDGGRDWTINMLSNAAGFSPVEYQVVTPGGYSELRHGAWDPAARVADMDIDMVDVHVMFPTYASMGPVRFSPDDPELQIACVRAYNDWLSEVCAYAPERLVGVGLLPATSVDDAIAEATRIRDLVGLHGVLLTQWPSGSPTVPKHDEDDRFWSALEDLDLAATIHVGFAVGGEAEAASEMTFDDMKDLMNLAYINTERQAVDVIPILSRFIFDGVFERHPRLRLGLTETGVGWIPFFLEQSDDNFLRHRFWTGNHLRMLPSEYFHQNCYATFQIDRYGVRNRDLVGMEAMMWSSDYPHSGADWPNSRVSIDSQLAGVPGDERRAILSANALRLFGLNESDVGRGAGSLAATGR